RDGASFDVTLKDAATLAQIRSEIEVQSRTVASDAATTRVSVTLDSATGKLRLKDLTAGANEFALAALYGSTAGSDLALTGISATGDTIQGGSIAASLVRATRLADIGAAGVNLAPGTGGKHLHFTLGDGSVTFDVDLTGAITVGDVIDKIAEQSKSAGNVRVEATIGAGNQLVLTDKTA